MTPLAAAAKGGWIFVQLKTYIFPTKKNLVNLDN